MLNCYMFIWFWSLGLEAATTLVRMILEPETIMSGKSDLLILKCVGCLWNYLLKLCSPEATEFYNRDACS